MLALTSKDIDGGRKKSWSLLISGSKISPLLSVSNGLSEGLSDGLSVCSSDGFSVGSGSGSGSSDGSSDGFTTGQYWRNVAHFSIATISPPINKYVLIF